MTESGIDLRHISGGPLSEAFEPVTRLLIFPDSVERTITLDRRLWDAYDTLRKSWVSAGDLEVSSYQWSLEEFAYGTADFEAKIRHWFRLLIQMGWNIYNQEKRQNINDNPV